MKQEEENTIYFEAKGGKITKVQSLKKIREQAQQELWERIKFFGEIKADRSKNYIQINDFQRKTIEKKFNLK